MIEAVERYDAYFSAYDRSPMLTLDTDRLDLVRDPAVHEVAELLRTVERVRSLGWGVAVDDSTGLVYASDMNSGLWIVRRTD